MAENDYWKQRNIDRYGTNPDPKDYHTPGPEQARYLQQRSVPILEPLKNISNVQVDGKKVVLELPAEGMVILTPTKYQELLADNVAANKTIQKTKDTYNNLSRQVEVLVNELNRVGVTLEGLEFLTVPYTDKQNVKASALYDHGFAKSTITFKDYAK